MTFILITRPGQLQRSSEPDACADDFLFFHMDDRRNDPNLRFRLCSHTNEPIKRLIVIRPTIRVTRTVLGDSSDENQMGPDDFCPGRCDGEKMSISKRNIAGRDFFLLQVCFCNRDSSVRQARSADLAQMVKMTNECLLDIIMPSDVDGKPFARVIVSAVRKTHAGKLICISHGRWRRKHNCPSLR